MRPVRTAASVLRLPRRTLRTQLALLYGGVFVPWASRCSPGRAFWWCGVSFAGRSGQRARQRRRPSPTAGTGPRVRGGFRVIGLAVAVMVALALGWLIAGRLLRPLRTITATARDISATNLHRRLALAGRDDEFSRARRHPRRPVRAAGGVVRVAAALRGQRLPRAADPAHRRADRAPGGAGRPGGHRGDAAVRLREVLRMGEQQERLIEALLTLASSERGIGRGSRSTWPTSPGSHWTATPKPSAAASASTPRLAPAPADGDPGLAESLVANLVDNAYGTTGRRPVEISTA